MFRVNKNMNASKLSEHPPIREIKKKKKGCKDKTLCDTSYLVLVYRYFHHAHFIPLVGVGKRGAPVAPVAQRYLVIL